jgi:hypothetical protein
VFGDLHTVTVQLREVHMRRRDAEHGIEQNPGRTRRGAIETHLDANETGRGLQHIARREPAVFVVANHCSIADEMVMQEIARGQVGIKHLVEQHYLAKRNRDRGRDRRIRQVPVRVAFASRMRIRPCRAQEEQ